MISVIMVQHNRADLTCAAVASLYEHGLGDHEIIVADNASTDESAEEVQNRFPDIHLEKSKENIGFGAANNLAAGKARGDYLFFLNNDTFAQSDMLGPLEEYMRKHPCGAAGTALANADGSLQYSTGRWPTVSTEWKMKHQHPLYEKGTSSVDWVTGAALCVRAGLFREIGGFDQKYFMYFEDVDLCRRIANAGHEIHYVPSIQVIHLGGGSQTEEMRPEIQKEYRRSQLRYYALHASNAQWLFLKAFLAGKAFRLLLHTDNAVREVGRYLSDLLMRPRNAHRA